MPKISIVIPNWNGVEKLKKHLPEVLTVAEASGLDEVIVVDDASTDNSVEVVKKEFPQVKLITKEKNTGFGSNVNLGVKNSIGDFIVLLNSDASLEKDFLKYALPHFNNQLVFSVGLNAGGCWSWAKFEDGFFWHYMAGCDEKNLESHQTLWSSGGSAIFRKNIWDQLGGLDPLYDPFYIEDLDLGYRATKRGFINMWEPKSKAEHYKEKGVIESHFSKELVRKISERNQLIFTWKNITSPVLINKHLRALSQRLILHPKYWEIFLKAIIHLPAILRRRKLEKSQDKITDEEILSKFST